jgi:hypothetical protein
MTSPQLSHAMLSASVMSQRTIVFDPHPGRYVGADGKTTVRKIGRSVGRLWAFFLILWYLQHYRVLDQHDPLLEGVLLATWDNVMGPMCCQVRRSVLVVERWL